jgi:dTDP-4-amino-4,6-dideoxygalactose transaminase
VKIITTAEGGMALTNNSEIATRLGLLRSHGITRDPGLMTHCMDGPWYYQQVTLGFNYRMTDMQAALGVSQMTRLTDYVNRRHEIAAMYNDLLSDLPITLPWQHPDAYNAYHLYVIKLQLNKIKVNHLQVFEALRAKNIMVNVHYIPVHTQPYYTRMGFSLGDFPEAEQYYREAISIPMHVNLTQDNLRYISNSLREAMQL